MPELEDTPISCGIRVLYDLCRNPIAFNRNDHILPAAILLEAFGYDDGYNGYHYGDLQPQKASDLKFAIILFSDSTRRGNGKKLAAFIEEEGLGEVVASKVITNPNTKRTIQMWTWYLNRPALVKWLKANSKITEPQYPNPRVQELRYNW